MTEHTSTANRPETWTLGRMLDWTVGFLAEKGSESPRLDAEVLLAHARGCTRIELYTHHTEPADGALRSSYRELVKKRIEGCPVAYLVGRKEFFSLKFEVSRDVLIPRPDTETLIVECLRLAKSVSKPSIVDIGAGSGNISISIAKNHSGARVSAVDISTTALEMARKNAKKHKVEGRIEFLQSDLFSAIPEEARFDFILSNPPYIAEEDWAALPVGVREYEPRIALAGGTGGYEIVAKLIAQAGGRLKEGGWMILEIGAPQESHVQELIAARDGFGPVHTVYDYSRHPRVLAARWSGGP